MRRAKQQTITFAVYDSTSGARRTGLSFSAGELQWSKDGANFANVSGAPVELLLNDGSTLSGVYRLVLSVSEATTGWGHLIGNKTGCRPIDESGSFSAQQTAAVVADASNSASAFVTNLTSAITDAHKGKLVRFQTGALVDQVRKVTGYNGTTKALSFADPFTAAPSAADILTLLDD